MKYLIILCACSMLYSSESVPVLLLDETAAFSELVSDASHYIGGSLLLSEKQTLALKRLIQESTKLEGGAGSLSEHAATLLQIMEVVSDRKGPISQEDILMLRGLELKASGWTAQDVSRLEKGQDVELLKKYVELARHQGHLNGFMLAQRTKCLQSVIEQVGIIFSKEDVETLRAIELKACGLEPKDILQLKSLTKKKEVDSILNLDETISLKKWIQLETLPLASYAMSFEESARLYQIAQHQSDPPFSPRELKIDKLAFQRRMEGGVSLPIQTLNELLQTAGNVSAYIGESETLTIEQVKACQSFVEATIQCGSVRGITPQEAGELLQLLELRPEFQQLMYPLQSVFAIELIKNGISDAKRKELDLLREKTRHHEEFSLSKSDTALLKEYVLQARKPGGLNGFTSQERALLFSLVQKNVTKGFTPADVEILRSREQKMNGFSAEEVYRFKVLSRGKQKSVSLEEEHLLKRFEQVERILGEGSLLQRP